MFFTFLPYGLSHAEDSTRGTLGDVGPQVPTGVQIITGPEMVTGRIEETTTVPIDNTSTVSENISETNYNTGPDSENINAISQNNNTNIASSNNANIALNSGANQIGNNSIVGSIETGEIDAGLTFVNISNSQFAEGSQVSASTIDGSGLTNLDLTNNAMYGTSIPLQGQSNLYNGTTGNDSLNINTLDQNNVIGILDNNNAGTNNDLIINANTGLNNVDQNTKVGDITTGDISLATNLINLQNFVNPNMIMSVGVINVLNDLDADIIIPRAGSNSSGDSSYDYNNIGSSTEINIEHSNNINVINSLEYTTNTGKNDISTNTVTGNIMTGGTDINSNNIDWLNNDSGTLHIINVFGEWVGDAIDLVDSGNFIINRVGANPMAFLGGGSNAPPIGFGSLETKSDLANDTTGSDSTNANAIESSNTVNLLQDNHVDTNNNVKIYANTGTNTISNNTAVGNIKTGSIDLYSNVVNIMNSLSDKAGTMTLKIINIFGNWHGNLSNKIKKEDDASTFTPVVTEKVLSGVVGKSQININSEEKIRTNTKRKTDINERVTQNGKIDKQIFESSNTDNKITTIAMTNTPMDPVSPKQNNFSFLIIPAILLIGWAGLEWYIRSANSR